MHAGTDGKRDTSAQKQTRIKSFGLVVTARPRLNTRPREQDLAQIRAGVTGAFAVKQLVTEKEVNIMYA